MVRRRELLHIPPHHLDEENLAEPGEHVRVAGTFAERLFDGMPQGRFQPVPRLDGHHR